jgi:hypothetical protein
VSTLESMHWLIPKSVLYLSFIVHDVSAWVLFF